MVAHLPPAALSAAARRALVVALVGALAGLYARTFVAQVVAVSSDSMAPALLPGDQLLVSRWLDDGALPAPLAALLPVRPPTVGDVLLFRSPEEPRRLLVKRLVATGGERFAGGFVPAGTFALVGDARERSHDSRAFGPVAGRAVAGRAVLVLWSFAPERAARAGRWLVPLR